MQATALHTALPPLPGAVSRAGLPGEPADDAPDFGQELRAATGRADEIALSPPIRADSRPLTPKAARLASTADGRQRAATARPEGVTDTAPVRGASVGPAEAQDTDASRERGSALPPDRAVKTPGATQPASADAAKGMARRVPGPPPHAADPASGTPLQTHGGLPTGRLNGESATARPSDAAREPAMVSDPIGQILVSPTTGAVTTTDEGSIRPITARMPAEAGTVTLGREQAVDDIEGTTDPMQALLPQRLLRLAEDGIETARIDLDIASTAPVEVRIARDADTVRVDLTSTDRQVRDRLEAALPAVAAALHAAGLKLADGGVHARLPDPGSDTTSGLAETEDGLDIAVDTTQTADASATVAEAEDAASRARTQARLDDVVARPEPQGRDDPAGPSMRDLPSRSAATSDRHTQTSPDDALRQAVTPTVASAGEARNARPEARMAGWRDHGAAPNPAPTRSDAESRVNGARPSTPGDTSSPTSGAAAQDPAIKPKGIASREAFLPSDRRADPAATDRPPTAQTLSPSETTGPDGPAAAPAALATDAGIATTAAGRSGLPLTAEARTVADRPAPADAPVRAGPQAPVGTRPQPEGGGARQTVAVPRELDQSRSGRAPAAPTAADQSGIQAMQTLQSLQALPALQAFMAGTAEGRTPRAGASASATDGPRAVTRTTTPRREPGPLRPEAQATAAAQMSLPAMMAAGQAVSPSTSGSGATLEVTARALEAAASSRQPDPDASALATGSLPTATGEATFSAALDLAGPALPEFMLRESLDSPEFAPALSARIATLVRDGIEEARIQLNPADMGPVAVQLAMEGSDVRVDLAAEVESTRQILEQALPSLASALRESGFTLTGGGVFQQPRDTGNGERGAQDSRNGAARPDPSTESVTTATVSSAGRRPRSGLVDLYA